MSKISEFVKTERMKAGLTQEEFALRSGLGLRFVRELMALSHNQEKDKISIIQGNNHKKEFIYLG